MASFKPVIVQFVPDVVQVAPVLEVTVYPVIALPPLEVGAVQDITELLFPPEVAAIEVGAPGSSAVVALAELDDNEVPAAFVAVTVKV